MDAITLALLKALGGGSGGSGLPPTGSASAGDVLSLDDNKKPQWSAPSSGGGVLVVNVTWDGDTGTLDKTWQEINDAAFTVVDVSQEIEWKSFAQVTRTVSDDYSVAVYNADQGDYYLFRADSATGYPTGGFIQD